MNTGKTIRKILFIGMWLAICSGMLVLLIAAIGKQKKETCRGYEIVIKGVRTSNFFLDEQGIAKLLKTAVNGNIKGQSKTVFDLRRMEQLLEDNVWIRDAQLYFDNKAVLHVSVEEREPVARVFTTSGRSFYIDNSDQAMPLSEKALAHVPVFTGFPDKKARKDTALLHDISSMAQYISNDSFWVSQVAQVDILTEGMKGYWEFEMVPVVGRHLVKLGDGEDIEGKFSRLFVFYQQVLNRTGLDHYKTIDVRFAGQVIGGRSDNPKVDSIQFSKKAAELLKHAKEAYEEELKEPVLEKAVQENSKVKPVSPTASGANEQRVPKAVMPKRNNDNSNN